MEMTVVLIIPRESLMYFLGALHPESPNEIDIVDKVKDQIIEALVAGDDELGIARQHGIDGGIIEVPVEAQVQIKHHHVSAEGRARIAAAQRKRWAKVKRAKR